MYLVAGLVNDAGRLRWGRGKLRWNRGILRWTDMRPWFPVLLLVQYLRTDQGGVGTELGDNHLGGPLGAQQLARPRYSHAMAADPVSGKVYVFGGQDPWATSWMTCGVGWDQVGRVRGGHQAPGAIRVSDGLRSARKSLILFGAARWGATITTACQKTLADTWEWNTGTRKWTQLFPGGFAITTKRSRHGDGQHQEEDHFSTPGTIPAADQYILPIPIPYPYPDAGTYSDPNKTDVMGMGRRPSTTWTKSHSTLPVAMPPGGSYPIMIYDEGARR